LIFNILLFLDIQLKWYELPDRTGTNFLGRVAALSYIECLNWNNNNYMQSTDGLN